jgi:hypothetical protein
VTRARWPAIEKLKRELRDACGTFQVTLAGLSGVSATKLEALQASGRDPLEINEHAVQTIANHWRSGFEFAARRGDLRTFKPTEATQKAVRALLNQRMPDGHDVAFEALDPRYKLEKIRRGLNPGISVARGFLKRDMLRAQVRLRRIR